MSVFRRRRRDGEQPLDAAPPDELDAAEPDEFGDYAAPARGPEPSGSGRTGPWDVSDLDDADSAGRVDLGGVQVPGRQGLELRVEADQPTGAVIAVTLVMADSALQVQPFAAPRTEGIWDEVRAEIRAGITRQGGTADEVEGPFGPELRTKVPVRRQDGSTAAEPARFLGVDGPRWFLRGVLTGRAAVEHGADAELLELFADIVVVRGNDPMAPRDPIPLRLPTQPEGGADQAGVDADSQDDPLNPFKRGPEITEIR